MRWVHTLTDQAKMEPMEIPVLASIKLFAVL